MREILTVFAVVVIAIGGMVWGLVHADAKDDMASTWVRSYDTRGPDRYENDEVVCYRLTGLWCYRKDGANAPK